jgi:hypothetical protein
MYPFRPSLSVDWTTHILLRQFVDRRYFGSVLRLNEARRVAKEADETEVDRQQGLRPPRKAWTLFGLVVAIALITTS